MRTPEETARSAAEVVRAGETLLGFGPTCEEILAVAKATGLPLSDLEVVYYITDDGIHLRRTDEEGLPWATGTT